MNNLNILFWNCNGIQKKIPELQTFVHKNNIHIILLGETRSNPKFPIKISNFITYRQDRLTIQNKPHAGGTAILINRNIVHQQMHIPTILDSTSIQIQLGDTPIQISAVYKSPSTTLLQTDLDALTEQEHFLIAGDLNAKHSSWLCRKTNRDGRTLLQHMEISNKYTICAPDSPTHYPHSKAFSPDILDIALVNLPHLGYTLTNNCDLSSDHNPITMSIGDSPITARPPISKKKINWRKFETELSKTINISRQHLKNPQEIDYEIQNLTKNIQNAISNSEFIPNQTQSTPKLTPDILLEIRTKQILRKDWQRTRDPNIKTMLNAQITYVRNLLIEHNQAEWDKFTAKLKFSDKSIYKLNRCLLHKVPPSTPLNNSTGQKIYDNQSKSELFATTMKQQFSNNPGPRIPEVEDSLLQITNNKIVSSDYVTPKEIWDIIQKLPRGKAPGYDNITNTALRHFPKQAIILLAKICTACYRHAYFPVKWKNATIVMIPKPKKSHLQPENYRPISLLVTMSKVLEKTLLPRLMKFITPRPEQHAFRPEHSTTTQLIELVDNLSLNYNRGGQSAAVFLDMAKAYDRVWHAGLLHKLKLFNIPLHLIQLLHSFLKDRTFRVKVSDKISSFHKIAAGVPQGSSLSPLLYSAYINDIPVIPKVTVALYADDTMFYTNDKNQKYAALCLQRQIDQTQTWLTKWRLRLNTSKTQAIIFGNKCYNSLPKLKINGTQLDWSTNTKYLGITLDRKLSMNTQVANMITRAKGARAALYPILRKKCPIPMTTKLAIFKIYIKPIILYAVEAWGPLVSATNWKKIEAIQNIAIRTITGAHYLTRNSALLNSFQIPSLQECAKQYTQSTLYRTSNSKYPHLQQLANTPFTVSDKKHRAINFKL